MMSKFIQKSKVGTQSEVHKQYLLNMCQYGKYYLKYWSQGINVPLDPQAGQNFQGYINWKDLLYLWGVYQSAQTNFI